MVTLKDRQKVYRLDCYLDLLLVLETAHSKGSMLDRSMDSKSGEQKEIVLGPELD